MDLSKIIFQDNSFSVRTEKEFAKVTDLGIFRLNTSFVRNNNLTDKDKVKLGYITDEKDTCYLFITEDGKKLRKTGSLLYISAGSLISKGILKKGHRYNAQKVEENLFKFTIAK